MPQLHSALVILNGKGAGNQDVREAIDGLRTAGNTLHVRVTWEHGDAKRYVAEAVELGVETIVAGGGDGTINEVSDALSQHSESSRPVLAVLPLGTANDFATACLIPEEPQAALQLALQGRAVPIDFARINDKRVFINMATGGFGTKITTETPEKLKSILGGASYFLHGILRMDTLKADFCQISGPVVSLCTFGFAGFTNCPGIKLFGISFASSSAFAIAPFIPLLASVRTISAP